MITSPLGTGPKPAIIALAPGAGVRHPRESAAHVAGLPRAGLLRETESTVSCKTFTEWTDHRCV